MLKSIVHIRVIILSTGKCHALCNMDVFKYYFPARLSLFLMKRVIISQICERTESERSY